MKACKRCHKEYELEFFGKNKTAKDGYRNICKECTKVALKIKKPDVIETCNVCGEEKEYINFTRRTNICKLCTNIREKKKRDNNREEYNTKCREWRSANKDHINLIKREREQVRRDTDPSYRLRHNLSTRLYLAVQKKHGNTMELTGCSKDELFTHIASKFIEGMNWENYGDWHIDHIKPCASFDLTDPEEQKKCFHWTNLQPLWAIDNMRKGANYVSVAEFGSRHQA